MESGIAAEVRLTGKDLKAFSLYHEMRRGRGLQPSFMILFGAAALLVGTLVIQLVSQFRLSYCIYILIVLMLPAGRYAVIAHRSKKAMEEYQRAGSNSRYDFAEDGVTRVKTDGTGTATERFQYDSYLRAVETKKAFYLYLSENEANIIPKGAITKGTVEDLRLLLNGKMGESFIIL